MQISDISEVGKDRLVGKRQQKIHRSVMGKVTLVGNHSRVTWQRVMRTENFQTVFVPQLDQVVL